MFPRDISEHTITTMTLLGGIIICLKPNLWKFGWGQNEWSLSKQQLNVMDFALGCYFWSQGLFYQHSPFELQGLGFNWKFDFPITESSVRYLGHILRLRKTCFFNISVCFWCGNDFVIVYIHSPFLYCKLEYWFYLLSLRDICVSGCSFPQLFS